MNHSDKKEEVLQEFPFLSGNTKWGGTVQVLRVTIPQPDGTSRVFINKRLVFTGSNRYINLPRNGIEEVVEAIKAASETERAHHETLIEEINSRRAFSPRNERTPFNPSDGRRNDRRTKDEEGYWK